MAEAAPKTYAEPRAVDTPEELTADWVTGVLRQAGSAAEVLSVHHERIGTGQIGASYRLHLEYSHEYADAGASHPPTTLVAKLAAGEASARERVKQGFEKEVRFYQQLASLTAVNTPRCWFADISDDLRVFTLLLDDLSPRVPGRQADGCSFEEARSGVVNLAGLHAPLWESRVLQEQSRWLAPMDPATGEFLGALMVEATGQFIARYRDRLPDQDVSTLVAVAARTGAWAGAPSDVVTVIHGDYRLDNLMFEPGGGSVMAIDWQTTSAGHPCRDLAYFLSTSLLVEDRPRYEQELLQIYGNTLAEHGVDYPLDRIAPEYRRNMLQGPLITVLGCIYATAQPTPDADEMFLAMATRSCTAIRDLASLEAVGD